MEITITVEVEVDLRVENDSFDHEFGSEQSDNYLVVDEVIVPKELKEYKDEIEDAVDEIEFYFDED